MVCTEQDAVDELIQGEDGASTVAGMSVYTDRTNAIATTTTASMSALTTGGKKPQKKKKRKKKGMRIRQGNIVLWGDVFQFWNPALKSSNTRFFVYLLCNSIP